MKRLLKYAAAGSAVFAALAALLATQPAAPAEAGPADDLPKVEKAAHKGYTENLSVTVKDKESGKEVTLKGSFDMVPIPGGTYQMGSPPGEKGRKGDEGPQRPVAIRPFWMASHEVRWDEFDLYRKEAAVGSNEENDKRLKADPDAVTGPTKPYADETFGMGREGYPVICITHHMAMEYCHWLSKKTGKVYRLPTEAEWEWAARAGTKTAYFFGDDPRQLGEYAWFKDNSEDVTHPVGKKKPNPWGLYDILGNVSEWCLDHYAADAYAKLPAGRPTVEPVVPPTANRFPHVARGGSWNSKADECRSASRLSSSLKWIRLDPNRPRSIWWLTSAEFVGFRVVRAVEEEPKLKGIRSKVTTESD
ncbi:MAG TPA: formylglycine-generating enzyme family protein [Gemmataceae bacterium]|nr:formylglycine-generating enzyme family protein [Gemmataceae bacterium]